MKPVELRDLDAAREYLMQGLWLQRVLRPVAATVKPTLTYALEIVAGGSPLPPIGFVADLAAVAFDSGKWSKTHPEIPGWTHTQIREYEDHLLGKLRTDRNFERASDALQRYKDRDRVKGLAYVVKQFRERAKLGGVELSPAILRSMQTSNPDELLAQGYESLTRVGPLPLLLAQYVELVQAARRMAEVLDPEDVIALEQRTALADMGEYVAHRQILQATAQIESRLPSRPVRPLIGRKEVPTRVLDEDQYPVGGYSSISTRGSIESLLHSQLAYMEPHERPDWFDVKFVRDELFFYSRDENQFLRRRRAFVFVFDPSLVDTRVKDKALNYQRIVLALSVVLAVARRLSDWLSTDAIRFELLFPTVKGKSPLNEEAKLLEILLSELRANGSAAVGRLGGTDGVNTRTRTDCYTGVLDTPTGITEFCEKWARMSQAHILTLRTTPGERSEVEGAVNATLLIDASTPTLIDDNGEQFHPTEDSAFDCWVEVVKRVLQLWV
jgi:hypothetical protein